MDVHYRHGAICTPVNGECVYGIGDSMTDQTIDFLAEESKTRRITEAHDQVWKLYLDGLISKSTFTRATNDIQAAS